MDHMKTHLHLHLRLHSAYKIAGEARIKAACCRYCPEGGRKGRGTCEHRATKWRHSNKNHVNRQLLPIIDDIYEVFMDYYSTRRQFVPSTEVTMCYLVNRVDVYI